MPRGARVPLAAMDMSRSNSRKGSRKGSNLITDIAASSWRDVCREPDTAPADVVPLTRQGNLRPAAATHTVSHRLRRPISTAEAAGLRGSMALLSTDRNSLMATDVSDGCPGRRSEEDDQEGAEADRDRRGGGGRVFDRSRGEINRPAGGGWSARFPRRRGPVGPWRPFRPPPPPAASSTFPPRPRCLA